MTSGHKIAFYAQESSAERAKREAAEDAEARRQTAAAHGSQTAVAPAFRTSPYSAEAQAVRAASRTARLLFLDEGNLCRHAGYPPYRNALCWCSSTVHNQRCFASAFGASRCSASAKLQQPTTVGL